MPVYIEGKNQEGDKWVYAIHCTLETPDGLCESRFNITLDRDDDREALNQGSAQCAEDCGPN